MFFPAVIPGRRLVGQRPQKSCIAFSPGKPAFLPGFQYIRNKKIIRFTGIGYQCKQHIARRHQKVIPHTVSFRQRSRLFCPKRRLIVAVPLLFITRIRCNGRSRGAFDPGARRAHFTAPRAKPFQPKGLLSWARRKTATLPASSHKLQFYLSLVYHNMRESQATSPLMLLQRTSPPMSPPCQAAALPCSDAGTGTATNPH